MRGASATMRVGDAGQDGDLRRDRLARVDQGRELAEHLAAAHLDRADLGDRLRRGRAAGGLQVDDDEGDLAQRLAEFVEGALNRDRAHTPDGRAVGRQFGGATRREARSGDKSASRLSPAFEKCHCRFLVSS